MTQGSAQLKELLDANVSEENVRWLSDKLRKIIEDNSARDLYMAYSLMPSKIPANTSFKPSDTVPSLVQYVQIQNGSLVAVARIYLLTKVLEEDFGFFESKVSQLMSLADTSELETFLKFLILLPDAQNFKTVAVDALRTNVATVFDAIALNNPYPGLYFNDQQWNQMYLKAAFMERDLSQIMDVDKKANKDLARIISDYAHERWAASREIDPLFWRPVSQFLSDELLNDMQRLLQSKNPIENKAGALCCHYAANDAAKKLLTEYPELQQAIAQNVFDWDTLKK